MGRICGLQARTICLHRTSLFRWKLHLVHQIREQKFVLGAVGLGGLQRISGLAGELHFSGGGCKLWRKQNSLSKSCPTSTGNRHRALPEGFLSPRGYTCVCCVTMVEPAQGRGRWVTITPHQRSWWTVDGFWDGPNLSQIPASGSPASALLGF